MVADHLRRRRHHVGKLHFTDPQRPPTARRSEPAEKEADELPAGIEAEAAGHHRVSLEVAAKEPEVRLDVHLGDDMALAVLAAVLSSEEHTPELQSLMRLSYAVFSLKKTNN